MLFSISQKLIQHQIVNYTEILKWLRDILVCRNAFLLRHKDYANCNIGAHIAICKQAHIKLEVGTGLDGRSLSGKAETCFSTLANFITFFSMIVRATKSSCNEVMHIVVIKENKIFLLLICLL